MHLAARKLLLRLLLWIGPAAVMAVAVTSLGVPAQAAPPETAASPTPTATSVSSPVPQSSPGLTLDQLELQQLLTKMDALDANVLNDQAQGTQRLLESTLPAGAALVVGLLAWIGVKRQTNSAKQTSREDQRRQVAIDRWRQALDVMRGFEDVAAQATLRMNRLRQDRLVLGPTGRDVKMQELAEEAQGRVLTVKMLGGRLTAIGIDATLFETYCSSAASFIQSAVRGNDVLELAETFSSFEDASDELLTKLWEVGSSLNRRINTIEGDLGLRENPQLATKPPSQDSKYGSRSRGT